MNNHFLKLFLLSSFFLKSQNHFETITFISSNPFSFNEVISNFENLEKQEVYGKLVVPFDSLNPKKNFP